MQEFNSPGSRIMSDFNGDNLLNVFKDLHVQLLNLSPNVIKGWFDTDDNNMKSLLKWMCTALSSDNFLSPLENAEYNDIQLRLQKDQLQREVSAIEENYPDIFDVETTQLDISILEDEIERLIEEDRHLDSLILANEELHRNLTQEWNDKLAMEIKTESELSNTQERCKGLSHDLDEANAKLHKKLIKYGYNLYNFEYSEPSYFINNFDVETCQEKYENLALILKPVLEDPLLYFSCSIASNQTYMSVTSLNESLETNLISLRRSISLSHQLHLNSKVEMEKMKEMLEFFTRNSANTIMSLTESVFMLHNLETKEETKRMMITMLENISMKITDQKISSTQLKYAQNELDMYQSKLDVLSAIEKLLIKLLCQYMVLYTLYKQEKADIESSDKYFRRVIHYINHDLQNCFSCTARMKEIIKEYSSVEPKEKFKFLKSMLRILGVDEDLSLGKACEVLFEFKKSLNALEAKVFSSSTDYRPLGEDMKSNIHIIQSFLMCGPTRSFVSIPPELFLVVKETEDILEKQNQSIKMALDITNSMKKKDKKKFDVYRRQLWMYFYTEPHKLKLALQQVEEEFLKLNARSSDINK